MAKQQQELGDDSGSKTIAFFDIDNTLVRGACLYYFGIEAYRRRYISFVDILRFARRNLSFMVVGENRQHLVQVRERALTLLAGRSITGVTALARTAVQKRVLKQLNYPTVERLKQHQNRGNQIWLATAAPEPLVTELQHYFGAQGNISTRLTAHQGVYTGELDGLISHAEEKARRVAAVITEAGVAPQDCWAYSDSYNDLPMLSMIGHPVAVNPDRKLEEHALEHGWEIIRIRKRSGDPQEPSPVPAR